MTLLNLGSRRAAAESRRRPRRFRPSSQPVLEGLEDRLVLSHGGVSAAVMSQVPPIVSQLPGHGHLNHGPSASAQNLTQVAISNVSVSNLAVSGADQLTGDLNLTGSLGGSTFNLGSVPFTATLSNATSTSTLSSVSSLAQPAASATNGTQVLKLSIGPLNLNVAGLGVHLDNCNGGPVTVTVSAIPSSQPGGGVLGNLLGSVNNALGSSGGLSSLGSGTLSTLTSDLTQVLNGALGGLLSSGSGSNGGSGQNGGSASAPSGNTATLVNLHLPQGLNLDVLGLDVQTSGICLTVTATQGGGLLGNLLYSVDNLLASSPGNSGSGLSHILGSIL